MWTMPFRFSFHNFFFQKSTSPVLVGLSPWECAWVSLHNQDTDGGGSGRWEYFPTVLSLFNKIEAGFQNWFLDETNQRYCLGKTKHFILKWPLTFANHFWGLFDNNKYQLKYTSTRTTKHKTNTFCFIMEMTSLYYIVQAKNYKSAVRLDRETGNRTHLLFQLVALVR